jgi:hypothetical protein
MERVNGDININVIKAAKVSGIKSVGFVAATRSTLPRFILSGYYNGKRRATDYVKAHFQHSGVIVEPGFIYGNRVVGKRVIPLGMVGYPMSLVLRLPLFNKLQYLPVLGTLFVPPISVETVAATLIKGVLGDIPAGRYSVNQMLELEGKKIN